MRKSYFKFYSVYLTELNKLNPFQFKKVINALSDYADEDKLPFKLSNKGLSVFNKIQTVVMAEKQHDLLIQSRSDAGKKGSQKRWNKPKNGKK